MSNEVVTFINPRDEVRPTSENSLCQLRALASTLQIPQKQSSHIAFQFFRFQRTVLKVTNPHGQTEGRVVKKLSSFHSGLLRPRIRNAAQDGHAPMKNVTVLIGSGSIGVAIARRVSAGKNVLLADLKKENAETAAAVLSNSGFDVSTALVLELFGKYHRFTVGAPFGRSHQRTK